MSNACGPMRTWLADKHGVILDATAEYPDAAANLLVAPNDGVQARGLGGQVHAILQQGLKLLVTR